MANKKKILTVSEDRVLIDIIQKGLPDDTYEVISTRHSGSELKAIIDFEKPCFIFQDIIMPSLDGIGACLQIRQWTSTPILMLTTWETGDGTVRGLNLCSDDYLTEPFNTDILRMRVEETLRRNATAGPVGNFGYRS